MTERWGEKISWTGGMLVGFICLAILALILLAQGRWSEGTEALLYLAGGAAGICICSRQRSAICHDIRLLSYPYALLLCVIILNLWGYPKGTGENRWHPEWLLLILPAFLVYFQRRWHECVWPE